MSVLRASASPSVDVSAHPRRRTHVLITGANCGIGLETAKALARDSSFDVITLACRDPARANAALALVRASARPGREIRARTLDLASKASCGDFCAAMMDAGEPLDCFVANAGVMALPTRETTRDGFEMQVGVNHLGHYAVIGGVFGALVEASETNGGDSRIVVVSSEAHRIATRGMARDDLFGEKSYSAWGQYGQSKLANVLFAFELARRCERAGLGIATSALHPGAVDTNLGRYLQPPEAEVKWWQKKLYDVVRTNFLKTPAQGAETSVYLARDIARGEANGKYYADCKEKACAKTCHDLDDARWLWERSAELTGVGFDSL